MRNGKWMHALCFILALMLLMTGCASDSDSDTIASLEAENAALQDEIDSLKAQLGITNGLRLSAWDMTAAVWDGGNGADIMLTATPVEYAEDMEAELLVYLDGNRVASIDCSWNGTAFQGQVGVSAADGYSYFCALSNRAGQTEQVELSSPDNLIKDALVNLKTSMTAYCSLYLDEWAADDTTLTIQSGFAQVQLPRLTKSDADVDFREARLVLQLNSDAVDSQSLELPVGEGEASYEATITDAAFALPQMSADDQLNLVLEATLTDGTVLTAVGGSWYLSDGVLTLVVG